VVELMLRLLIVRCDRKRGEVRGEWIGAYRNLVARPEGRGPLGRFRRRWEDNIKMDF
jgi:hypothetical protein